MTKSIPAEKHKARVEIRAAYPIKKPKKRPLE
jgi:hypothetical protein